MVHTRINERTANPNPHINFITALPPPSPYGAAEDEAAKELLRALAAQLKPVMKSHGLSVNSFEEYESNKVFLGRNWNNGETVELVLRNDSGRFYPTSMLLGVFCHELAHIKHMTHSHAFHTLRRQLSSDVAALQRKGYYGDGYWSAGTRLSDSQRISSSGWMGQDLPEYTCGGAHPQSRPSRRRRRARKAAGPSLHTGAQTVKRRKAGSRIKLEVAGEGSVLDERVEKGGKGSGFRKQAGSRKAREEREMAAEKRLKQMQDQDQGQNPRAGQETSTDEDPDETSADFETDEERLKRMRDVMGGDDLRALRDEDCGVGVVERARMPGVNAGKGEGEGWSEWSQDNEGSSSRNTLAPPRGDKQKEKVFSHIPGVVTDQSMSRDKHDTAQGNKRSAERVNWDEGSSSKKHRTNGQGRAISGVLRSPLPSSTPQARGMVNQEIRQRKREAMGMDRPRKLGGQPRDRDVAGGEFGAEEWTCRMCTFANTPDSGTCLMCEGPRGGGGGDNTGGSTSMPEKAVKGEKWACLACTFENEAGAVICGVCERLRE